MRHSQKSKEQLCFGAPADSGTMLSTLNILSHLGLTTISQINYNAHFPDKSLQRFRDVT